MDSNYVETTVKLVNEQVRKAVERAVDQHPNIIAEAKKVAEKIVPMILALTRDLDVLTIALWMNQVAIGELLARANGEAATTGQNMPISMAVPDVVIYTDGSCLGNPGVGGWGAVLFNPVSNKFLEISGETVDTTNNRMELKGAIEALKCLKRKCRVLIRSDSEYLTKAYTEKRVETWRRNNWKGANDKPIANQDLWEELDELVQRFETTFEHIQRRSQAMNVRADVLAQGAAKRLQESQARIQESLKEMREKEMEGGGASF